MSTSSSIVAELLGSLGFSDASCSESEHKHGISQLDEAEALPQPLLDQLLFDTDIDTDTDTGTDTDTDSTTDVPQHKQTSAPPLSSHADFPALSATVTDEDGFYPILSKSARRRERKRLNASAITATLNGVGLATPQQSKAVTNSHPSSQTSTSQLHKYPSAWNTPSEQLVWHPDLQHSSHTTPSYTQTKHTQKNNTNGQQGDTHTEGTPSHSLPSSSRHPGYLSPTSTAAPLVSSMTTSTGGILTTHMSPLYVLYNMFPSIDREVIQTVFTQLDRNQERVIDFLLEQQDHDAALSVGANISSPSTTVGQLSSSSRNHSPNKVHVILGIDSFSHVSQDIFFSITDFLDSFDIGRLSRVSHELKKMSEQIYSRVTKLCLSSKRYSAWKDEHILYMISKFTSLQYLDMRNLSKFHGWKSLPMILFGTSITHLIVSNCQTINDLSLSDIMQIGSKLESLDISHCAITDDGLEHIAQHGEKLEKLNLSNIQYITSYGVARVLNKCLNLKQLDLKSTRITLSCLNFPQADSNLLELKISACCKLSGNFFISSKFCALKTLYLNSNIQLKNVSLNISTLETLNLSNSTYLERLMLCTPSLQHLNLNGCLHLNTVTHYHPYNETLSLKELTSLNTNQCRSLTSNTFQDIFQTAINSLSALSVVGCIGLMDSNISYLVEKSTALMNVELNGCKGASSNVIQSAKNHVHKLNLIQYKKKQEQPQLSPQRSWNSFNMFSSPPSNVSSSSNNLNNLNTPIQAETSSITPNSVVQSPFQLFAQSNTTSEQGTKDIVSLDDE